MRHQRAYGAALSGLTCAVIVCLTLGTTVDPLAAAAAHAVDNAIGIGSALFVAIAFGPPLARSALAEHARTATAQAMALIAQALTERDEPAIARERAFLLSLATLEASAEDIAAGSIAARRKLRDLNALLASLLDLIVMARAIRSREIPMPAHGDADMDSLREAFSRSAEDLSTDEDLDIRTILAASRWLQMADPVLSPLLAELATLLNRAGESYRQIGKSEAGPARRWSTPHPDAAGLRLAILSGVLAALPAGLAWLPIGWGPLRYLMLGSCIFTVLFSTGDEPAAAVRQIFTGALGASVAALLWRVAVVPEVANGWLSLALAVPLVFGTSLLQARQGSMFLGLASNMLFAILARPVDTSPGDPIGLATIETLLLVGIANSYVWYRWLLPMDTQRRRQHLKASIRREIAALSIRAASPWARRHLARLRYLVFTLAVRSRSQAQEVEDALAALSLGHVLFRLGEMQSSPELPDIARHPLQETLRLTREPMSDPASAGMTLHGYATRLKADDRTGGVSGSE